MLRHVHSGFKQVAAAPGGDPGGGRRPGMAVARRPKKVVHKDPFTFRIEKLKEWRAARKKLLVDGRKLGEYIAADARRAMNPRERLHRPHRLTDRMRRGVFELMRIARELKRAGKYWAKPLSTTVGGIDMGRPGRLANALKLPSDAHKMLDHIDHEFRRSIYTPDDKYTVLRGGRHVRHRDYRHHIIMPAPGDRDGYRKIAMKTMPTHDELEKKKHHFYKVGLMADFVSDIKMSKNIQVRLFKNLIEIIVKGTRVKDAEIYVLAHFLSLRPGSLYAVRGRDLSLIFEIDKETTDSNVARYIIREQQQNVQHFVLRPHHHTHGHPIAGPLAKSATYKKAVGGKLTLDKFGEGLRKVGRSTGRMMAIGGAAALAGTPIVAIAAPAAAPGYAAISGGVGAAGLILHQGLAKHADMT